jgi:ABC-type sugar transport system substrate-binding protein
MAMGARKAFSEIQESERARWMKIPITGCDGMPKTGQAWVRNGTLAATIFIRPNADLAIETLVEAFKSNAALPERKVTDPESVPSLADLAAAGKMGRGAGA